MHFVMPMTHNRYPQVSWLIWLDTATLPLFLLGIEYKAPSLFGKVAWVAWVCGLGRIYQYMAFGHGDSMQFEKKAQKKAKC